MCRVLLLFDIDGTLLLKSSGPHRAALYEALEAVYGLVGPDDRAIATAGRTDTQIARDIASAAGIGGERFDANLVEFQARCADAFKRLCPPSLATHVGVGIGEALEALNKDPNTRLSLLTGNYEPIARLKLERAGIGHYFAPCEGAFGSDSEDRDLLGPIARARAGNAGVPYPPERTVVIGDTPLDIACARADRLGVIAIATGPHLAIDLASADHVVGDGFELLDLLRSPSWSFATWPK
jgi:phosphoglycolate phosphatase